MIADTAINPIKILVLFISMTVLSIFLDELGFFKYLASCALKRAGNSQLRLFIILYATVSVLTVFTSNDIIILSFTPFICYFAKNAHINPLPYLAAEFVAANTWSMALIIGNPTNIYLVTAMGGNFLSYVAVMILPTLAAGLLSCFILFFIFRKKLSTPIDVSCEEVVIEDKLLFWAGIIHLALCTVILAVGSYIGIEMWLISLTSVVSLFTFNIIVSIIRRKKPSALLACLKRAPWDLIPFVISMFVVVEALNMNGVTNEIYKLLGNSFSVWKYGFASFFASNLINNIPMSVLFSSVLANAPENMGAIYATVVGSNLGACFTPIGALAGIMWSSILREHNLKFGYLDFLKIGITVAIPSLIAALGVIALIV
jgi:arsenical pump membrane protein